MAVITNDWTGTEYFKVNDFNHLECYVGNAKQSLYYYCYVMGFTPIAYQGPETGCKEKVSYVLKKNQINIILTTPLITSHPASDWIKKHGDGICDIALNVENSNEALSSCVSRGAISAYNYNSLNDKFGQYNISGIETWFKILNAFIYNPS